MIPISLWPPIVRRTVVWAAVAGWMTAVTSTVVAATDVTEEMAKRSVLVAGDQSRLQAALAKAARGEPLVLGFIGGSITAGANASNHRLRYTSLLTKWFKDEVSHATTEVNRSWGGTGSDFGAYRVQSELLSQKPDIVFVDFSVNDGADENAAFTMEAMVRQILQQPNHPAVVMLGMVKNDGTNTQAVHEVIARHYGIPYISIRDALWPEISENRIAWNELFSDSVHPNDEGHAVISSLAARFLEPVLAEARMGRPESAEIADTLPDPLNPGVDDFVTTAIRNADEKADDRIRVEQNDGWKVIASRHGPAWESREPGSILEFSFEGKRAALLVHTGAEGLGIIEVTVDGGKPRVIDLHETSAASNRSKVVPLAQDLSEGKHLVTVRHSQRQNPSSPGNRVELRMVLVAGGPDQVSD